MQLALQDMFLLSDADACVAAELERRMKVKADREKRQQEQDEENDTDKIECDKWKSLHMSLAEQSILLTWNILKICAQKTNWTKLTKPWDLN